MLFKKKKTKCEEHEPQCYREPIDVIGRVFIDLKTEEIYEKLNEEDKGIHNTTYYADNIPYLVFNYFDLTMDELEVISRIGSWYDLITYLCDLKILDQYDLSLIQEPIEKMVTKLKDKKASHTQESR